MSNQSNEGTICSAEELARAAASGFYCLTRRQSSGLLVHDFSRDNSEIEGSAHEKLSGGRNVRVHLFVCGSFYCCSRFGE
jgi:hypothetical protein